MCTAITYKTKDHYFGRTLDYFISYEEKVVITPRNFPLVFRKKETLKNHYGMIGMAAVAKNQGIMGRTVGEGQCIHEYPLYFDATNEKGLSMAGLSFPENAAYKQPVEGKDNIAPFEFIPWILGQCENVIDAKELLSNIHLVELHFSDSLPLSPLHWIISDRETSLVVESVKEGLKVYNNPVGVLTNNPPFPMQMFHLNNYLHVSVETPKNCFSKKLPLHAYSYGMGGMGLPGDFSSQSRFVRGAFVKMNSVCGETEVESISQFFHIMGLVSQPRGCVVVDESEEKKHYEKTIYTSCCNTDKGIYYYTTYENSQITGVDMGKENLEGTELIVYPLIMGQQVYMQKEIPVVT